MKEAGYFEVFERGSGRAETRMATAQCCHCGKHFPMFPKKGRGWCMNCNGAICGARCLECVPKELQLENLEQGRPVLYRPAKVNVPANIPIIGK